MGFERIEKDCDSKQPCPFGERLQEARRRKPVGVAQQA